MRLLVIDDSQEHLDIIQDIFETEGYTVIPCHEAFRALAILEESSIDCIILDLKIPVLEGNHLLTVIHEKYPKVPVIILSGHVDDEADLKLKGAYAVMTKPPNISALIANVEHAIHETKRTVSFVFEHTNLNSIKDTVISRMIALVLKKTRGNQKKAAHLLGISRQCFIRYMKKYQIAYHA